MTVIGVDVSGYQGQPDWAQVKAAGIRFAIISGGDGGHANWERDAQVAGARAVGLYYEMYHYCRLHLSPEQQAAYCRQTIAAGGGGRLWLDMEDTSVAAQGMSVEQRIVWLTRLVRLLSDDAPLGIYTGAWWWRPYMGDTHLFRYLPLWIAAYLAGDRDVSTAPTYLTWALPGDWGEALIWQFTSSGSVPGIAGRVDMNVAPDTYVSGPTEEADVTMEEVRRIVQEVIAIHPIRHRHLLVREAGTQDVYQVVSGYRLHMVDAATFEAVGQLAGFSWSDVIDLPAGHPVLTLPVWGEHKHGVAGFKTGPVASS